MEFATNLMPLFLKNAVITYREDGVNQLGFVFIPHQLRKEIVVVN